MFCSPLVALSSTSASVLSPQKQPPCPPSPNCWSGSERRRIDSSSWPHWPTDTPGVLYWSSRSSLECPASQSWLIWTVHCKPADLVAPEKHTNILHSNTKWINTSVNISVYWIESDFSEKTSISLPKLEVNNLTPKQTKSRIVSLCNKRQLILNL